jgi:hypothetical protein
MRVDCNMIPVIMIYAFRDYAFRPLVLHKCIYLLINAKSFFFSPPSQVDRRIGLIYMRNGSVWWLYRDIAQESCIIASLCAPSHPPPGGSHDGGAPHITKGCGVTWCLSSHHLPIHLQASRMLVAPLIAQKEVKAHEAAVTAALEAQLAVHPPVAKVLFYKTCFGGRCNTRYRM